MHQRQDGLREQMASVLTLATNSGCYDAADWLKRNFFELRLRPRRVNECCARDLPAAERAKPGDLWQCPTCTRAWTCLEEHELHYWEPDYDMGRLQSTL